MAIDINNLKTASHTQLRTNRDASAATKTAESTSSNTAAVKTDSVSITSQAQQLQGAQSKMASLPEIDQSKVDAIKTAISEGRYKVDPEKLAANIASFEADMSGLNFDQE
ncbi:flagellar biosynthesis anti-sigma factor FlgM [Shewanella sp. 1_MG-2023]|uniref:Negative regulator of flagellin synthesis n=1 Tax=Shewanella electrodiphila TaxID=934143 RepID=A0ABT0KM53_9GAMM|nr:MULTISPECIES: flagellar biosynthesis anti-sigma factor FlgM [Shewanella]MCC4832677.1 flagellar biosynthesis anti-sigma factor FlgM [Shewanella sp. 10N.7]MCL1044799.1 flagellar biosynthesis anti-sigma factor FlgM [Shewanella electrodiphila]MDO6612459.1 flagellar biosynthesis anti-sigma factor FlgM [Shewanella sp. 7_MG-2023]MDO6772500.1 flagellar biosynthesis anti-sigma factor FlgM [Shewanella sp. 2_MG-2023]MDO6794502.1 flagellar biosynthesis anti-sigma factor FlgM [Shewanella sp. 1_MG-2023]